MPRTVSSQKFESPKKNTSERPFLHLSMHTPGIISLLHHRFVYRVIVDVDIHFVCKYVSVSSVDNQRASGVPKKLVQRV